DPVDALRWIPAHALDRRQRPLPETLVVDVHEPLLGRPEDQRTMAAPAVRVAMPDGPLGEQRARRAQRVDHGLVARLQVETGEWPRLRRKMAARVHRRE